MINRSGVNESEGKLELTYREELESVKGRISEGRFTDPTHLFDKWIENVIGSFPKNLFVGLEDESGISDMRFFKVYELYGKPIPINTKGRRNNKIICLFVQELYEDARKALSELTESGLERDIPTYDELHKYWKNYPNLEFDERVDFLKSMVSLYAMMKTYGYSDSDLSEGLDF